MDHLERVGDHVVLLGQCAERREDGVVNVLQQKNTVEGVDSLSIRCHHRSLINLRLWLVLLFTHQIVVIAFSVSCQILAYLINDCEVLMAFLLKLGCGRQGDVLRTKVGLHLPDGLALLGRLTEHP